MKSFEILKDIYWVGAIDWDLKEFHGYSTPKGTTYNAYLILDEKIVLVDTVRNNLSEEMLRRISKIIDPSKIDYVISNHSEMDHSGSLPEIMKICKNATLVCSPIGEKNLKLHFNTKNWNIKTVNTFDEINIGKRNLKFILTQMVHWPDSMATYISEDKLLMPNDAFGQHIASNERFEDEFGFDEVLKEAKKYYANIVLPYSRQVKKAVSDIENLDIEMIAPSHGLIWKTHIKDIIDAYKSFDQNETKNKAVIIYDTMWGSTKLMAETIYKAFQESDIDVELKSLKSTHISDIMTEIIDAKYICIGSPTLNNTTLPTIASFLCYLKGLKPQNRVALSFGSYGWAPQGIKEIEGIFDLLKYQKLDSIAYQYVPTKQDLEKIKEVLKVNLKVFS